MDDLKRDVAAYERMRAQTRHSRREFVAGALAAASFATLARPASSQDLPLELSRTPRCDDSDEPTISTTEGPFFRPNSPMRHELTGSDMPGRTIIVGGFVLDTRCRPLPNVLVEAWQADSGGEYDQQGFELRGHQWTDKEGRWWFATIIPGPYGPRTRHIHIKLQQRNEEALTTQLFFPNEPLNQSDYQYDDRLLMTISEISESLFGRFDFVL